MDQARTGMTAAGRRDPRNPAHTRPDMPNPSGTPSQPQPATP
jgi:hypothetical protein